MDCCANHFISYVVLNLFPRFYLLFSSPSSSSCRCQAFLCRVIWWQSKTKSVLIWWDTISQECSDEWNRAGGLETDRERRKNRSDGMELGVRSVGVQSKSEALSSDPHHSKLSRSWQTKYIVTWGSPLRRSVAVQPDGNKSSSHYLSVWAWWSFTLVLWLLKYVYVVLTLLWLNISWLNISDSNSTSLLFSERTQVKLMPIGRIGNFKNEN